MSPLRPLARKVIDYVETYPWNNQYTLAGRESQEQTVEAVLAVAYNLGAQALMDRLAAEAEKPGCGDEGCVEHGSLPAEPPFDFHFGADGRQHSIPAGTKCPYCYAACWVPECSCGSPDAPHAVQADGSLERCT